MGIAWHSGRAGDRMTGYRPIPGYPWHAVDQAGNRVGGPWRRYTDATDLARWITAMTDGRVRARPMACTPAPGWDAP